MLNGFCVLLCEGVRLILGELSAYQHGTVPDLACNLRLPSFVREGKQGRPKRSLWQFIVFDAQTVDILVDGQQSRNTWIRSRGIGLHHEREPQLRCVILETAGIQGEWSMEAKTVG